MSKREWFGEWFDSPFYHILYQDRDHTEAMHFIDNVVEYLQPAPDARFLDLACGKGRHSIYLNEKGYDVTGLDLSPQNIEYARQYSNSRLRFVQHDMRQVYMTQSFDYVVNLFTSFGYFDTKEEHQAAICAVSKSLKSGGVFLLDFLNPYAVINELVPQEIKSSDGIDFHITRRFDGEFILKDIEFLHKGESYQYQEKVKAIRRVEFLDYFEKAGLKVIELFGNYDMAPYDKEKSDRLIFLTQV